MTLLRLLIAVAILSMPNVLAAHIGHSGDGLLIDTIRAEQQGDQVAMIFLVRNTGDQSAGVELLFSETGEVQTDMLPTMLQPGDVMMLQARLIPDGEIPGLFTIVFDFGDGSAAPVVVVLP